MTEKHPTADDWSKAEARATRKPRRCSKCGDPTHTLRDCPNLGQETYPATYKGRPVRVTVPEKE